MTSAIEATGLTKSYPPDVQALRGIDLHVPAGTIFGLLGPNGAGKSTTVRILTALSRPDSGSVTVAGVDALARPNRVRARIGVVGQRHGAAPAATGRENLVLQGEFQGLTGRELKRRVQESLERFGLADAADRQARTYSGGMQRRLDIAMGLLHRPSVLFLDEPTTGLDPESRADMWREIQSLASEEEMTILLTTHYMEEADKLAAHLAIVDRGLIVTEGTPSELKAELDGDAIHIQLTDDAPSARGAVEQLAGVHEVSQQGHALRARARDGASALPTVLAALESHGITVAAVTVARPSLDDVYLRHAGHLFEDPASGSNHTQEVRA